MPSFDELLADKTTYPDEQKITLSDGVEVTVGSLRSGFLRQQDYTQKTQTLARERQTIETERQQLEQEKGEAEDYLKNLAVDVVKGAKRAGDRVDPDVVADELAENPVAKRLMERIEKLGAELETVRAKQGQQDETLAGHERAYFVDKHRAVLAVLRRQDPDLKSDELVEYAKANRIPYLDVAYRAYRHDHLVQQAAAKAKQEGDLAGFERGKREATSPAIPPRRAVPKGSPDAPKTFEEAADLALRDPEVLSAMEGL